MSGHETRLREWLALGTKAAACDVEKALDALLAEHRAEVERLRWEAQGQDATLKEVERLLDAADRPRGAYPTRVREALEDLAAERAKVAAARDAALEEAQNAVGDVFRAFDAQEVAGSPRWHAVRDFHPMVQRALLALQSAPATVLDAANVREVLTKRLLPSCVTRYEAGANDTLRVVAVDLGLSLDAEGAGYCDLHGTDRTECGRADHTPREPSTVEPGPLGRTGPPLMLEPAQWDAFAAATCHLCPRLKHTDSCYGADEEGAQACECGTPRGSHDTTGQRWRCIPGGGLALACSAFRPREDVALSLTRRCTRCGDPFETPADEMRPLCDGCMESR